MKTKMLSNVFYLFSAQNLKRGKVEETTQEMASNSDIWRGSRKGGI
jgi:hypothetical protein